MTVARRTFALTAEDVALLGGVSPSPADVDETVARAELLGFELDWTRIVSVDGMTWQLTVTTPRGRFECVADTEESWHAVLESVGLVE